MPVLTRRALGRTGAAGVASFAVLRHARAEAPLRLRVSLDTAPSHGRNISIADYLKKVETDSNGRIKTELFSSGALFADLNVAKALVEGQVEMACPGHWTQTGLIPDCDMFQLPMFYGQDISLTHRAVDGKAGAHIAAQIEQKLRSHVVGKWLDLGYQNWYTTARPINSLADLKGMKIRSPGGAGNAWRIRLVGGIANTTAWPNVPLALSQGTFDGFISTDESCASGQLWEAGVKHSYADHQFIGEYIPVISLLFWNKLSPDLQKIMTDLWEQNIGSYRASMLQRQIDARKVMESKGVTFVDPTAEQLAAARTMMNGGLDQLIKDAKLSPEIVKLAQEDVGTAA
jgi:C4-dicarboxylate-binding protein DctP